MNLKRYRVNNIKEALKEIKQDLGSDAMIVSTRQVRESTGAFGMFGKTMLEVTAAPAEKKKESGLSVPAAKAIKAYSGTVETGESALSNTFLTPRNSPALSLTDETRKLMQPIQKELQGIRLTLGDLSTHSAGFDEHIMGELKNELGEMRQMLNIMASRSGSLTDPDLPENLLLLYQQMKFGGLEERFARRLVLEAERNMSAEDAENFPYVKIFIARMLMKIVKITRGLEGLKQKQRIVALLGPTGVGKTTTAAKIASEQMQKYKRKVALISVDTNRSSAAEQLRSFAKKISAPFSIVKDKAELNRIIVSYEDYDSIIIDTDGFSQRNDTQLYEMRELFDERGRIHNTLVLSATSKDSDMIEVTRKFGCMPLDSIIFTKLDESAAYGSLFNHAIRFKKPLSYLTLGQEVPTDLEVASRERLVDLLLNISGT
ncbi:MAG: flagellar biosynthesis protein FlhF [SAR324 cluster bacterium]|nr:flagellar biosynthesis protein FlhF [SAR324 cluster bacterium]MBL7035796.1 flagellar biosynthesis protein FlhF [SAR324 cluster bacterium]